MRFVGPVLDQPYADRLADDPRVTSLEGTDIRALVVGDRVDVLEVAVDPFHGHPVCAGDLNVLHGVVVDQRLQPAQTEQGVVQGLSQRTLLLQ